MFQPKKEEIENPELCCISMRGCSGLKSLRCCSVVKIANRPGLRSGQIVTSTMSKD